ncbi:hypothetical protein CEUSTIGMA_g8288.t1 [Chlamydomonas eustigma]|uniref:Conserved oligomeric Golgi complex subunit 2 n=1 Tax=Chlamydomonas eustigma TaxID=1157962 RepID=A0A250XCN5_9CHLO|nr:hypothetical protein CEUSTIGMA_g8288.t1 [Chlamydomonas eustigma]|eukprot:GAX80853.1 hypothetical protein CEUSTIGMA_g8288.t1 [Chlamydomonas eustigma]
MPVTDAPVSIHDLLGNTQTFPVWLDPERFLEPGFQSDQTVLDLRRFAPLATLHNDLNDYLTVLKSKLVEVINEDYGDYVSLSSRLVNVEGFVMRMKKPLMDLKDKMCIIQEAVKTELSALNQGLKRRKDVSTARSLLELLQELAHVASKVEKLLEEVAASENLGVADLDSRCRLLERVAGEVSRLSFQANRGKDLAFVKGMEAHTSGYRSQLETRLQSSLEQALSQQNLTAALHCLHGYVELGEAGPAESTLRMVVVKPLVARLVAEHKKVHVRPGHEGEALNQLLQTIFVGVKAECGPLLEATLVPHGTLRIFDFLGNAVLEEVQTALASELPAVFSPGVPPAFHANYLAASCFVDKLEGLCQGRSALDKLRSSTAYTAFFKRWNLSVYFSLLYQDIAGELEGGLSGCTGLELVKPPNTLGLQLPASATVERCLRRAVSSDVFLVPLGDRFLRLLLQIVQRYRTWVQQGLSTRVKAAAVTEPLSGSQPSVTVTSETLGGGVEGEASVSNDAAAEPSWLSTLPTEDLSVFVSDLSIISELLSSSIQDALRKLLLATLPEESCASACGTLTTSASSLSGLADAILDRMADEVAERCVGVVKQLKGITATYRMTTKGPPTRHSHYVTGALAPLRSVLDSERCRTLLPLPLSERLIVAVADVVSVRYHQLADELLKTVRKTEESLKRLKKATADVAGDGMSDSDKIGLQLYLDAQEYGNQLTQFGLVPAQLTSYQALLHSVSPSQRTV